MAGSSTYPSMHLPIRNFSLPSREHPISLKFDAVLNHLKAWQILSASETAPFGAESFQIGLVGLAELYNYVDQIILTPQSQQTIVRNQNGKLVEEALDGSITLLDTCGTAKDALLMMKEHVQALQSAFRRKGRNSSPGINIQAYLNSRKKVQKEIAKCLSALKNLETKVSFSAIPDADKHVSTLVSVIREASTITVSIFRSLLLFLSMPEMKIKCGISRSQLSRFILPRPSSSEKETITNEFKSLDLCLFSFREQLQADDHKVQVKKFQKILDAVNLSVDSLENELECVSRCLVQNRVCLLNILTQ